MRISDWSSDVCSSDLPEAADFARITPAYTAVPSATRRLSRPLRRAFDYYDGSVAMQVRQAVLFRRSRSYASEESRCVSVPHSFTWSHDGGHAGRTGSDSQGHAHRSARDGVSAAFTITNPVIVGKWRSENTVFTMHTLPVGQPPDCGAQFRSVRSEERRVGKECGRTGRYRWSPDQ